MRGFIIEIKIKNTIKLFSKLFNNKRKIGKMLL